MRRFAVQVVRARALAVVGLVALVMAGGSAQASPTELFLSEYIEGTSNNKALEIFNGTGSAVNLATGGYDVQMFFNGSATAGLTIALTGTVADGDVYVLAQATADPAILAQADQTNGAGWFNGNDAVVLRKGGVIVDAIGQIGLNPGTEWGTGDASTADNTLVRKPTVQAGDPNGSDAFDPSVEWNGFPTNTFGFLGSHSLDDNDPVIASCDGPLNTDEGTAATAQVSASDADGTVIDIEITSVNPSPAPGSITLSNLAPAPGVGGTATADVTVDALAPAGTYSVQITATNDDATPQTGPCTLTVNVTSPATPIHDIQGAAHLSPLAGTVKTSGIVTALRLSSGRGFYLQDPNPDADDATSEGIFVFTNAAPTVSVGDAVAVTGTVLEFRPGGSTSANLTTTELTSPSITVLSSGNPLPAATIIGAGGRAQPDHVIEDDATGDVETSGIFDPAADGIDFYESLEAMLVQVNNAVATGPTSDFGEISLLPDGGASASLRTPRGGIIVRAADFNPERVILDDVLATPMPVVNVGDTFSGATVGVVDYSFGNFKLLPTAVPTTASGGLAQETTTAAGPGELAVATLNVENLDPTDPPAKFAALAGIVVNNLGAPDLLSVEEVQDNDGPANTSVVDASATLDQLVAAIQAAGGPTYDYRQIDPVDDQDGGEPGGNIRVALFFRGDRGLSFVDRPGGGSTTPTTVVSGVDGPELSASPGRIEPTDPAFVNSRKPLAGELLFQGSHLFAIGNHFNSKGGDQPLFGHFQPPNRVSEVQRHQQAQIVNDFVDSILALDPDARIVVLGDLNDFDFSDTLSILEGGVLDDLIETLPEGERYSYVFEGNSQVLDHVLSSADLTDTLELVDAVHVNAEFAAQTSDHDPVVAQFCADATPPLLTVTVAPNELFPPNHKYRTVNATVGVSDNADPDPTVTLVSVTSNEPDSGLGGGDLPNDIVIVDDDTFRLRAERASGSRTPAGRIYTITYRATDDCGNAVTASATVTVPRRR